MYITLPIQMITPILLFYVAAAVLPAIVLLHYVHRHDTAEKEPPLLLLSLLGWGCLAAVGSLILEKAGVRLLDRLASPGSPAYPVLLAFLVVAVAEEGLKFFFLYRATWRHPAFNYRFDGVVYAVFVSLGFAALENVLYVFSHGLGVAVPRALLAVPGHMAFSIFMGIWYGRAKLYEGWGDFAASQRCLWTGFAVAVVLHGVYDACALTGTMLSMALFAAFMIVTYLAAFRSLKRESANDVRVS